MKTTLQNHDEGLRARSAQSREAGNNPPHVAWSLAACARIHYVTIRQIARGMGLPLKRVREVRDAKNVPEITAWNFVQEIKAIAARAQRLGGQP